MTHPFRLLLTVALVVALAPRSSTQTPAQPPAQPPGGPSEISLIIGDTIGGQPRYGVPDFLTITEDRETAEAARTIAQVLWDDLEFEREFQMIPRDTYRTIPQARALVDVPFDRWRELGADGVVIGTVQRLEKDQIRVQARLFNVRTLSSVYGVEFTGPYRSARAYAHQLSDEIHWQQAGLKGVARTKLAFVSDRDSESVLGLVESRQVKELYIADYDGAGARRVTVNRTLSLFPSWSTDGRSLAYTSYRRGYPDVLVSHIYQGSPPETPAAGSTTDASGQVTPFQNWLPAWSPDGRRVAFTSNRDGNSEIYVMNADGSGLRRLTNHPEIDSTPTWSPTGRQIAFTSNRSGSPQLYLMEADGTGLTRLTFETYADRPTWSPAPYNEIAFSARTGPGFDIKILDVATKEVRQITFGIGSNESPSFAPNGRHLAFMSTRGPGKKQIYTIGRDGRGLRQITNVGNNETPNWSP